MENKRVNIYADEVQNRKDPNTGDLWHYIGIIIEDLEYPLLPEIIKLRFCNNFDNKSPFYSKNNEQIHWVDIKSANQHNILERWFSYILYPDAKSWKFVQEFNTTPSFKTFRFYILGINSSKLNDEEFDSLDDFCSKYNRFFRSAVLFSLKYYFPEENIFIENIFHEEGSQEHNKFFPWHTIFEINKDNLITTASKTIEFLPKDHKRDERSNIIQLCDCILGASINILHGLNEHGSRSKNKEDLIKKFHPLFERLIKSPNNKNSHFKYYRRMSIDFFPLDKSDLGSWQRNKNQFYKIRPLVYMYNITGQRFIDFGKERQDYL